MKRNKTPKLIVILSAFVIIAAIVYWYYQSDEPKPITTKPQQDRVYLKGARLFERHCAACHPSQVHLAGTGPALGGITERRNKTWLYRYTRTSYRMYEAGDSIAISLRGKGWGLMPAFPMLNNPDLDAIYYFVEKQYAITKAMRHQPK
jgi:mono/diheme cytochrome c family protein